MNRTSVFTPEEEQKLWDSGILANDNPNALQHAVFFYSIFLLIELHPCFLESLKSQCCFCEGIS